MITENHINVTFGNLLDNICIPQMYRVRQKFSDKRVNNVCEAVRRELEALFLEKNLSGLSIAVTAGSRGISHTREIMEEIIHFFQDKGAHPFVIPAVGSHGGGTSQGQLELLEHFGLTPSSLGVPFQAEMDTIPIGALSNGTPVYFSKAASQADGIFIWNKVKPHADFKAEHESGLVKMLAIGLGKHRGCASLHRLGFENFSWALPEAAALILKSQKILGGLAIVENPYDEPFHVEAVSPEHLLARDAELLKLAKANMPSLGVKDIDVLVIDEIGKNISGEGMDPNITGRPGSYLNEGFDSIRIKSIVTRDVTAASDGNGAGIGMADITTINCAKKLDLGAMYTNSITAGILGPSKLPVMLNSDREAILTAIKLGASMNPSHPRMIRIQNTLKLDEIWVSEALVEEFSTLPGAELLGPASMAFDSADRLQPMN